MDPIAICRIGASRPTGKRHGPKVARGERPRGVVFAVACMAAALLFLAPPTRAQDVSDIISGHQSAGATPSEPEAPGESPAEAPKPEPFVRVGVDNRVTMHIVDLPLADALRMLAEPSKRNIILSSGATGAVTASLYDVTFDQALDAILVANGLGYRKDGGCIYVHPAEELDKFAQSRRRYTTRVFRLTYINAASVKTLIEPMLSERGKVSTTPPSSRGLGGSSGMEDTEGDAVASTDALIVSDYEDVLDDVARVIKDLDGQPKQVLIEATILRATLNDDNSLGIDFTTVGGIDFATLSSVSPAAQSIQTGNIPTDDLNNTNFTVRSDFNAALPDGGFTFGILKDQVGVFVRALEQMTDTSVLANPKLLALNKQVGQVIVGRRDGYLTTTITETTAIQTVEFLETGTVLTFRPFIGEDGTVRMEIHPKDSTGGLTDANLPFEQTTEVTTNILVKDGRTILIGGLFREVGTAARGQIPVLGNIPIAGALFRRTRDVTIREEVIILLTVHVVKNDGLEEKGGEEMAQDIERYRVGLRNEMQWFGRERLSQSHYRWALEHLAKGNTEMALWDAGLAIELYPQNIHAMKLCEDLKGRRMWESEASSVRTFVRDLILRESGEVTPAFGRPGPPFDIPVELRGGGFEGDVDDDDAAEPEPEPPATQRATPQADASKQSPDRKGGVGEHSLRPSHSHADRSLTDAALKDTVASPLGRSPRRESEFSSTEAAP